MSNYICQIRCSYRQPNGYCGSTGGWERCQYRQLYQPNTVVGYVPPLKKTNADRIRSMTDEELANCITDDLCDRVCHSPLSCDGNCEIQVLAWLKHEASDD